MKKIILPFLLAISILPGCKKYLDINSDPDTPQEPDASSVFPAMLSAIPRGTQYDGRYVSKYIQNFAQSTSANAWDVHNFQGYPTVTDVGGDIWRQCYFGLGANLNYIIDRGLAKGQWDYVGAGYALKALIFQMTADEYGDIIYTEAFKENTSVFKYDPQDVTYRGVDSLCRLALDYLGRSDLSTANSLLSKGDFVYNGDRDKWIKLVNGVLAMNFHRLTNKAEYTSRFADSVIKYVDRSFINSNEDFVIPFDASKNDDSNFYGPYRDNLTTFRQTKMIVGLLDGSLMAGAQTFANRDPRIRHMLSASNDTTNGNGGYRGLEPGIGEPNTGNTRTAAPFGDSLYANPSATRFDPSRGKYLFRDKVISPVITYSQLQFTKAEAAYRKSATADAYTAYINGINGHFDFINRSTFPRSNVPLYNVTPISAAQRSAYMTSANVAQSAGVVTLTDIMLQKYIALWGWNFFETWVDMRRFHYLDNDPVTNTPVYRGFVVPAALPVINAGKLATRIRPRYNSEYVWNLEELTRIGATAPDYHVKDMWFMVP
ncbi:SusD/RagB family nutrient-binding outer membrane lipoprotein [Terrimonas sp. NA20]|uniref:SusD/RagB family nutrient-binding outer membrane lipoprotein n=1 Tax=Terrimonas ginsenosidimutans TaxID=2908004 RepID=A0ABS9KW50_9BACT|nr:SusD/RagB family nutrient-binding outer membrane lipoprotein [Terrimonas ginsenosidimutans]MCG2616566.1 SusD/RagB family nutrient-binding outer membrane lipoprotein [Terrimonas ginsenosidimutans]